MKKVLILMSLAIGIGNCYSQPIGTILAWSGNPATLDPNWKICDGSQVSKSFFPDLCAVIGDYWGPINRNPAGAELFTLPDLRGMILRGVNQGRNDAFTDPEASSRKYVDGTTLPSNKSNQVGSYQLDAFQGHAHNVVKDGKEKASITTVNSESETGAVQGNGNLCPGNVLEVGTAISDKVNGQPHISSETRSKNVYIYWIIKAK